MITTGDILHLSEQLSYKHKASQDYQDVKQELICYLLEQNQEGKIRDVSHAHGKARRYLYEYLHFNNKLVRVPPTLNNRKELSEGFAEGINEPYVDPDTLADEYWPEAPCMSIRDDPYLWMFAKLVCDEDEINVLTRIMQHGSFNHEVAEELGISEVAVSRLLKSALEKLNQISDGEE